MIKEYNGAITFNDVLESHPAFENVLFEMHNEEVERINRGAIRAEGQNIIDSFRRR